MAKKPSVKFEQRGLQVMATSLKKLADDKYRIQVGIFGDKDERRGAPNGVTNAEIGYVQEMGSVSRHIPRRSFLLDTFAFHGKELMKTLAPDVEKLFKKGKVDEYLKQCGIKATNLVVEAFMTSGWGAWPPNAYSTLLRKLRTVKGIGKNLARRKQAAAEVIFEGATHAKPLIDTGQLWQAISSRTVTR